MKRSELIEALKKAAPEDIDPDVRMVVDSFGTHISAASITKIMEFDGFIDAIYLFDQ